MSDEREPTTSIAEMSDEDFEKFLADRSGPATEPPAPPRESWRDNPWLQEHPDDEKYRYREQLPETDVEPEPFSFDTLDDDEFAAVTRVINGDASFTDRKTVRTLGIGHLIGDR
jgi:hypothetical protein